MPIQALPTVAFPLQAARRAYEEERALEVTDRAAA